MTFTSSLHWINQNGPQICEATLAILGGLKVLFHYLPEKYENPADRILDVVAIPFRWLFAILQSDNPNGPPPSSP